MGGSCRPIAGGRRAAAAGGRARGTAIGHSLLYARVRSQADELNRLAGVQADFLRGVTHDLQTPLTSIGALATELRANPAVPDEARSDLDTISHQAIACGAWSARCASPSHRGRRPQAGGRVFALRPSSSARAGAARGSTVSSPSQACKPSPSATLTAGAGRLGPARQRGQVQPAGSPIEVALAADDGSLSVTVRDHGTGMDPETREHAFDQFFRAEAARRLAPDGSGVGLYAARGLVEAMGGSVAITARSGPHGHHRALAGRAQRGRVGPKFGRRRTISAGPARRSARSRP